MKNFLHPDKEFLFNEVLFENRNKNYGAYVLRNEEGKILMKSLFIGIAFFGAISITPLIINSFKAPPIMDENFGTYDITPIDEVPEVIPEVKPPVTPPQIIKVNTVSLELPTPTKHSKNETPAKSVKDIENANIGPVDVIGDPPTNVYVPINVGPPAVIPQTQIVKPVDNSPVIKVDIEAEFNGGINAFRNKVVQNFDTDSFNGTGDLMKTTVTFIVEKDGTISGIKANGENNKFNREAEITIKNIKGKWNPAKLNGQNVRSYFKFPISMQFE